MATSLLLKLDGDIYASTIELDPEKIFSPVFSMFAGPDRKRSTVLVGWPLSDPFTQRPR